MDTLKKPTLVRRLSDMFKDGEKQPSLFGQASMKRIRDCCQNLNLFPQLLITDGNSKNHPLASRVSMYINLLKSVVQHVAIIYAKLQFCIIQSLSFDTKEKIKDAPRRPGAKNDKTLDEKILTRGFCPQKQSRLVANGASDRSRGKNRKDRSFVMLVVVYMVPVVLGLEVIGICCLMTFGKYTPGFVFLISALVCLGFISVTVLFHGPKTTGKTKDSPKQKTN